MRTDVTARKTGEGRQAWTREPLTTANLTEHVSGGVARGVSQIHAGESTTRVAVLDFDSHGGETPWAEMAAKAAEVADVAELMHGLRATAWRSSGGRGVHLYFLWDAPQDAYSVRELLREVLGVCGLGVGTGGVSKGFVEVFPKQSEVASDGFGNQVVLPLAGASVPLVLDDGGDLT
ncbi:MAG: hypothetical protein ABIO71_12430 [Caldimonas sp.]